ncbi:hypothetical protein NM208_g13248 [Fusarium decemcellulare]|uniref:Uncharacterized protein n=1 Tax=Fusarium decemcellulare TaxID=57161 RepID=A0ACC1RN27_9HYPO|nr:hypothetical protein NM208_g13248 [Fusarium decemcellulare]
MTFTVLMLVYRNPNMTPNQFKDHYENKHIPLMKSLAGKSFPISHTRRYIQRAGADQQYAATVLGGSQADFEYDCVSELKFETEDGFKAMSTLLASPELSPQVGEDCAEFMDPGRTKVVVLGETNESLRD